MKRFIVLILLSALVFPGYAQIKKQISGNLLPGVSFKIKRCLRSGSDVIIDLQITNESEEDLGGNYPRNCWLYTPVLFDDEGNEYNYYKSSYQATPYWEDTEGKRPYIEIWIPAGISKRFRLHVPKVSGYSSEFQLMEFNFMWTRDFDRQPRNEVNVRYRNIPIRSANQE